MWALTKVEAPINGLCTGCVKLSEDIDLCMHGAPCRLPVGQVFADANLDDRRDTYFTTIEVVVDK